MRQHEHLQWGAVRLRAGPWRGDADVAELVATTGARAPSRASVEAALERLAELGYRAVVTGALSPAEQPGYLAAGFDVHEHLHLLERSLEALPRHQRGEKLRRGRRSDRAELIALDHLAFEPFWRLDLTALHDALAATPASRLRVSGSPVLSGYAITGRSGPRGYLQRLAVHPAHQRRGIGSALVIDAMRWLRRWGARGVSVNTQVSNASALGFYDRLGFVRCPGGLDVLTIELTTNR